MKLGIFSGEVFNGFCGQETGKVSLHSRKPLCVGDIVQLYHIQDGEWKSKGLTCVVNGRYTTYSDGKIADSGKDDFFVMGVKGCGFDSHNWVFEIVKSHTDAIEGEKWTDYGFNYRDVSDLEGYNEN